MCRDGESSEFAEGWIDVGEGGGFPGFFAVFAQAGSMDEKGNAGGLIPELKFFPVLFFANMEAVITPEDDDGVVFFGRVFEGLEEAAEFVIDVADTGEVALHEDFPLLVFDDPVVPRLAGWWTGVVEVIGAMLGELDVFERVHVEEALRDLEGDVGAEESDGEEEGFFEIDGELCLGPVDDHMIAGLFVGDLQRLGSKELAGSEGASGADAQFGIGDELGAGPIGGDRVEWVTAIDIPSGGVVLGIAIGPLKSVEDFATSGGVVAVVAEVLR